MMNPWQKLDLSFELDCPLHWSMLSSLYSHYLFRSNGPLVNLLGAKKHDHRILLKARMHIWKHIWMGDLSIRKMQVCSWIKKWFNLQMRRIRATGITFPYPPEPMQLDSEKLLVHLLKSSKENHFAPWSCGTAPLSFSGSQEAAVIWHHGDWYIHLASKYFSNSKSSSYQTGCSSR